MREENVIKERSILLTPLNGNTPLSYHRLRCFNGTDLNDPSMIHDMINKKNYTWTVLTSYSRLWPLAYRFIDASRRSTRWSSQVLVTSRILHLFERDFPWQRTRVRQRGQRKIDITKWSMPVRRLPWKKPHCVKQREITVGYLFSRYRLSRHAIPLSHLAKSPLNNLDSFD